LDALREAQRARKTSVGYDRHCRSLTAAQMAEQEAHGITPVVRLKAPLEGQTTFHDVLYGTIRVENETLDDLVLLKSDGFPTYHLANVVDDHLMEISHIMRGDEWLPSVPKHILLYDAFGWEVPIYAHLPLILAPSGKGKLSKRHGGVELRDFRQEGYLPEAMINYLARVGWSYDDKTEIFDRQDLIRYFDLPGINNSPARFSYERLESLNAHYIRQLEPGDLAQRLAPFLQAQDLSVTAKDLLPIVPLIQERLKTLREAHGWIDFFFQPVAGYPPEWLVAKKMNAGDSLSALAAARDVLSALPDFGAETIEHSLRALAEKLELKLGQLLSGIRVAVTGKQVAPPLFESLAILGREETLLRLSRAIDRLAGTVN
jgi:glutamyl-tRNA synthetase